MKLTPLRLIPMVLLALLAAACASIGRPEGGPRDELPPVFVRSTPMPGDTGVDARSITIYFDENVQLEDAFNKVVISPVQIQAPTVTANGRRVSVRLNDTVRPDMTYTIDFGDAIKDLNEGNVLDGFALDFSTGGHIDTMRISGVVLQASNLEPAQGILVGAYSNTADSAIRTLPPDRIARTNQRGQFTIRNLAPGSYRVYAFNDLNRDFHWDRSEDIAFLDSLVTPSVRPIEVVDTLYSSSGADSLVVRPGHRFLPNDVLLTWFNLDYRAQYVKDYRRDVRRKALLVFGAEPDSLPRVRAVGGGDSLDGRPASDWAVEQFSARGDSLTLWLREPALGTDSLMLAVSYRKPDSLDRLQWTTDTLRFFYREPRRSKKEIEADTLPPALDVLQVQFGSAGQEVNRPLQFALSQPVETFDTAAMRMEMQVDTLWKPVALPPLLPDSADLLLGRRLDVKWAPGAKYRFIIDSAAIVGIYGEHNKPVMREFTVRPLEDYSNITFNIKGADSTAVVELLSASDEPVLRAPVTADGRAVFRFVNPGTYYARLFFDSDRNGRWTTGIPDSVQPEEVAYYPRKLDLRRNWDVEQAWDIYELPVDAQKPQAILKNKPKLKRGEEPPPSDDDEEIDDDFLGSDPRTNQGIERRRNSGNRGTGGRRQQSGGAGGAIRR